MNKAKILVVEDDKAVRNLITTTLETQNYQYHTAEKGSEALLEAVSFQPDVMLLDLGLPDMDGIAIIEKVRGWSGMPIIVISARSEDRDKIDALDAGADDYLTKPFELEELWARIQVQLRRTQGIRPSGKSVLKYKDWTLNLQERSFIANKLPVELTSHEMGILELLIKHPKKVFTKQEIFEVVWQQEYFIEDKTIHVHISNIRAKLKKTGTDHYIQTVWGIGFKLGE